MISTVLTKVFGTQHERDIKRLLPQVEAINALEPEIKALDDEALRARTFEMKAEIESGKTLDDILVPAFAVAREAAWRVLHMRPYDVQLIGGMILHKGRISEMRTGEGKTLTATLPVYLNALSGKGVHVVTVNDYLARRDAEWMGQIYRFLGLTVGCIQHGLNDLERQQAYACDITYGTNNELGFDYLRDNMKFDLRSMVQRGHNYAIVDEVDSILIDEARTPLIISGPAEDATEKYYKIDRIVPKLERGEEIEHKDGVKEQTGDFLVDEKAHTVQLTDQGSSRVERLLGIGNLYEIENIEYLHGVNQALRAHHLYKRDVNYMIQDGKIVIVDEFTGRAMPGRRWSDGLHQAVEAKEGVKIERENQTLATITFQNYFRMYDKLAGMTGTADTEAAEFGQIYKLDVTVIPTHRPMIRDDRRDLIYGSGKEKWEAVVEEIKACHEKGQPVLVGTVSIENSEMLSAMLKRKGVRHVVLNAKYHEREASIVAQAGRKGSVTIATNMAGRGTDIVLGGNPEGLARSEANPDTEPEAYAEALARYTTICEREKEEVLAAGGLHILGTERHESRRIDNQLRGRAGRQGDPGSSRFYLSLEDDLMRLFIANETLKRFVAGGLEPGEPIESRMVSKAIERAQKQVEGRNFEIRKNLLEYDDVMNKQREAIYAMRQEILKGELDGGEYIKRVSAEIVDSLIETHCPSRVGPDQWELSSLSGEIRNFFDIDLNATNTKIDGLGVEELRSTLLGAVEKKYAEREARIGRELLDVIERDVLLRIVDQAWKDHLLVLDHLKEGIGLRGYGQRDPKNEYKRESYELFTMMKEAIEDSSVKTLYRLEPVSEEEMEERRRRRAEALRPKLTLSAPAKSAEPVAAVRVEKVGRNDLCPCGSGKKYKKCHGASTAAGV
jgi:preprotein translocase subunit SecA